MNNNTSPSEKKLNSLVKYYQAGQYDDAEILAISIIKNYPNNQLSWKVLGALLKKTGRLEESLTSGRKAVLLSPADAEAHNNLAKTLMALGNLEEAEKSFKDALALEPNNAELHNSMGNVVKELGRAEQAMESFGKSISLNPTLVNPRYNLGQILFENGQYKNAIEQLALINYKNSQGCLLKCYYYDNQQDKFWHHLDKLISQGNNNALIGSLISRAKFRYGISKKNPFCNDPLNYVLKYDLREYCDFSNIFIKGALRILNDENISSRAQNNLINGKQTSGNIFDGAEPSIKKIKKVLHSEIEKYRSIFKDSSEGLINKWPTNYSIFGWLVEMKSGGALNSHMHDGGWLTGSVYINVPPKLNTDSGNLVVCTDDNKDESGDNQNRKSIDVVTGSLCLFPSSLLHHTIPFESSENRVVLAFDVIPES